MQIDRIQLTYEDYLLIPEDGKRHEIIDGEEYMSPAPGTRHQTIVVRLASHLQQYADATGSGQVFVAPTDVRLSDVDVVQPDVFWVSAGRASIVTEAYVSGAPDLVIEVLSQGTRRHDLVRKRRLYERAGVAEYWAVDPELEAVTVFRRQQDALAPAAERSAENGDTLESPLLPGFTVAVGEIFK